MFRALLFSVSVPLLLLGIQDHVVEADDCGKISWQTDANAAWKAMKEKKQPIFLFVTLSNCRYCDRMRHTTLCDDEVSKQLKQSFLAVELDGDANWAKQLNISIYPTTLVILPDEKLAGRLEGYVTASQLRERLAQATNKSTRQVSLKSELSLR